MRIDHFFLLHRHCRRVQMIMKNDKAIASHVVCHLMCGVGAETMISMRISSAYERRSVRSPSHRKRRIATTNKLPNELRKKINLTDKETHMPSGQTFEPPKNDPNLRIALFLVRTIEEMG